MPHSKNKQIFFQCTQTIWNVVLLLWKDYEILDSPRMKPKDQIAYEGL